MRADPSPGRVNRRALLTAMAGFSLAGTGLLASSTGALRASVTVPSPKKPARIGVLWSVGAYAPTFTEKELGPELARLGQLAGRDYVWEVRNAEGRPQRIPELAAELVSLPCDIITATASTTVEALQQATRTIPLVVAPLDALGAGLVADLAQPGGNLTGYTYGGKPVTRAKLKLLKDVVPGLERVAVLASKGSPNSGSVVRDAGDLANEFRLHIQIFNVPSAADVERALEFAVAWSAEALLPVTATGISDPAMYGGAGELLVDFDLRHRLPLIVGDGANLLSGPLLTYTDASPAERAMVMARQIDRILRGVWPGSLPMQQSRGISLTVNLKTAQTLGLTIPPVVLARATKIVQ